MIKLYLALIIAGLLAGAYYIYKDMEATIATLRENNAKLELVVETNQATIKAMEAQAALIAEANQQFQIRLQESERYRNDLISKLQRHDLSKLSFQRPAMIEKRINDATQKLFDELESSTTP
jgi:hypothetical protein